MNLLALFKTTDKDLFSKLGRKAYIRNGVGAYQSFISDEYLYDNAFIEIGIGRVTSGKGDWGGGYEYSSDSPLKIIVDKNCIIQKVKTASFYNSKESQRIEKVAEKFVSKLKIGTKFIIKDAEFKEIVEEVLNMIPRKGHIGFEVFEQQHMLKIYKEEKRINEYPNLRESNSLVQTEEREPKF